MKKLDSIEDVKKSLENTSGDAKTAWKIQYPVVDIAKLPAVKKALWGFREWAEEKNVTFTSKTNRSFTLKGFKFDFTVAAEFKGTLQDVGLVISNYIEILRSVNLIPSDTEPHLHSINSEQEVAATSTVKEDEETDEPWDDCDNECYECEHREDCPNAE